MINAYNTDRKMIVEILIGGKEYKFDSSPITTTALRQHKK